ncbi:hypothetical protein, partial [Streptomyces sp. NPDC126514]|uniref:hypothetical protein n=1 Tax=Streptomyces sp. NPDC126514 TaxID=3155210 RepID=UPI0033218635
LEQFPQLIWHQTLNDPHDARLSNTPNETTSKPFRRRLMVTAGLVAVGLGLGLGVVALVLAFSHLAAPLGTSVGVVAAVVPLLQRLWHGGAAGGGSANEP